MGQSHGALLQYQNDAVHLNMIENKMCNDHRSSRPAIKLGAFVRFLAAHDKGVAAVEFAMIAPILLILMIGTLEMGTAYTIDRRVSTIASSVADLVARETEVMDDTKLYVMTDKIARALLAPYNFAPTKITVISIQADNSVPPTTTIDWSKTYTAGDLAVSDTTGLLAKGRNITTPAGLMTEGSYMIAVEVTYAFTPLIFGKNSAMRTVGTDAVTLGVYTMKDRFYYSPRNTQGCVHHVTSANCSSPL